MIPPADAFYELTKRVMEIQTPYAEAYGAEFVFIQERQSAAASAIAAGMTREEWPDEMGRTFDQVSNILGPEKIAEGIASRAARAASKS